MITPKLLILSFLLVFTSVSSAAEIDPFIGSYTGSASVESNGETRLRDMNVIIAATKDGYEVTWTTIVHKAENEIKEKQYSIEFLPTSRAGIFSSAMRSDVFGNKIPLNPMEGDPYVWSRISGKTFTVYALHIAEDGGYEMQEYNRTLISDGLDLDYQRIRNGVSLKNIKAFLKKN
jgi:hypothetical protein